jgi:inner membrane protein
MTHAAVAVAMASWVSPRTMAAAAFCAMLPDADVVAFALRIPYSDMLGHRGLSHSIAFAGLIGGLGYAWRRTVPDALCLFLATLSHGLLDAMTDGGRGVAFFAPFSGERYFFPWTPIEVSPLGLGFFSARGASVFASELLWVWIPSAAAFFLARRHE